MSNEVQDVINAVLPVGPPPLKASGTARHPSATREALCRLSRTRTMLVTLVVWIGTYGLHALIIMEHIPLMITMLEYRLGNTNQTSHL